MASSNVCWGIELGAGAIKALKLQADGENLKVLDFLVIPHKKVLSTPDLDIGEATRVALGELVSQRDMTNQNIAISVPGNSAFARFAKLPPVEPKKVPDIVKFEAVQQIPFPIDDVEWDYQTFASKESPDLEVGIFAMRRDSVMERLAAWADVGITPSYITLSPISAFNAVAYDMNFSEKTPGTVILDVGASSTDLIVAEAGRVWVRTFPIGGHQFTEALVEAFQLTYSKAEKLKREAETSKHARHVFQAMRPVFSDLAQDVQRSIGYYQSLHREANLTRLIVFGSTFNLPGLKKYLGQQLQMEVVQLPQFNRLSFDGPQAGEFQAATLNLATAYGLALQGLGYGAINANLIPKAVVREAMWKSKTKWFAIAAGLSIVAGGASFLKYFFDNSKISANPTPTSIQQAVSARRDLDGQWKQVESSFVPDFRAANSMVLLDGRDIVPWLVDDLGQIFSRAKSVSKKSAEAGGSPDDFRFIKYLTQYTSAGATDSYGDPFGLPEGDPYAPIPGPSSGGRRGEPQPPLPAPNAPPAAPAAPTDTPPETPGGPVVKYNVGEGPPRVLVTLQVATTRPGATTGSDANLSATEFVRDTVQRWLEENALNTAKGRELVPYEIFHIDWKIDKTETIAADANQPIAAVTPGRNPNDGGGNRGKGRDEGRMPQKTIGPTDWRPEDMLVNGGQGARNPASNSGGGAGTGNTNLDSLAPLPKTPPLHPPGSTVTYFTITWEAYLKKPVGKEGGA